VRGKYHYGLIKCPFCSEWQIVKLSIKTHTCSKCNKSINLKPKRKCIISLFIRLFHTKQEAIAYLKLLKSHGKIGIGKEYLLIGKHRYCGDCIFFQPENTCLEDRKAFVTSESKACEKFQPKLTYALLRM